MAIYIQSTLELKPGNMTRFNAVMIDLVSIVEAAGWTLVTAVSQISGRLHTAIDLWLVDDMNHYMTGVAALRADPRFDDIAKVLADSIERETLVFGVRAPWVPEGR